jgi:ABC-2 type transport system ATP-binding protein
MPEPVILVDNLVKRYGKTLAVDGISFTVERGVTTALLGGNGAGKTTTIKMLVGLLKPSAGSATIAGYDIQRTPQEAKRQIGFIPDRPFLYEKLSGREFLRFVADLHGLEERAARARGEEFLELFELTTWGDELIESYSHGMRQKLVMCAALLHQPRVLVVDEPMVGLDPKGARLVKRLLRGLCDRGTTIFMSTHTLEVAEQMCDRIGIVQAGELVALGTKEELRQLVQSDVSRLEDIFLQLTGGADMQETIPF